MTLEAPKNFLKERVHDLDIQPSLTGLCAGYELGIWRMEQLADHLLDWLPEFALTWEELNNLHSGNARQLVRRAARAVYDTDKYGRRGEFGELLLHIAVRQVFGSFPAISKIYYKDAANDTVKGFDCVHTVEANDTLELWLGEAKFYSSVSSAIRDACQSIEAHSDPVYLRSEFSAILNKLDPHAPIADRLRRLLEPETSLDDVFDRIVVPVMLTYDSPTISSFNKICEDYIAAFIKEIRRNHQKFAGSNTLTDVRIHLFLLPLESKMQFQEKLHEKLISWQTA